MHFEKLDISRNAFVKLLKQKENDVCHRKKVLECDQYHCLSGEAMIAWER